MTEVRGRSEDILGSRVEVTRAQMSNQHQYIYLIQFAQLLTGAARPYYKTSSILIFTQRPPLGTLGQ